MHIRFFNESGYILHKSHKQAFKSFTLFSVLQKHYIILWENSLHHCKAFMHVSTMRNFTGNHLLSKCIKQYLISRFPFSKCNPLVSLYLLDVRGIQSEHVFPAKDKTYTFVTRNVQNETTSHTSTQYLLDPRIQITFTNIMFNLLSLHNQFTFLCVPNFGFMYSKLKHVYKTCCFIATNCKDIIRMNNKNNYEKFALHKHMIQTLKQHI